jgi:hypothetical protein
LKELDPVASHQIHQSVLAADPTRPGSRQNVLQRFGLANSRERLTQDGLDQGQNSQANLTIGFDPVAEVLTKLGVENGVSRNTRVLSLLTLLGQ